MAAPARKTCTIIGSNKGGVGKSLIALMQTMIYDNAEVPLRLIEIDYERKLSSILGDRVDQPIDVAVKLDDTARDRFAAVDHYNKAYERMAEADSLIDLGANVTTSFFDWYKHNNIGHLAAEDDIGFRFIACAAPDEQALASALSAVAIAREALGETAEYFVVLNDIHGSAGFAPYASNPGYLQLLDMERRGEIGIVRVDYCDSLLFEHGKAMHMTPIQIVEKADLVAKAAGIATITTRIHRLKLMKWLERTQEAMDPMLQAYQFDPAA